jgi:hypothetical protein
MGLVFEFFAVSSGEPMRLHIERMHLPARFARRR